MIHHFLQQFNQWSYTHWKVFKNTHVCKISFGRNVALGQSVTDQKVVGVPLQVVGVPLQLVGVPLQLQKVVGVPLQQLGVPGWSALPPSRRGGGRGKKSAAKSEGNVANLGGTVKWAKVGLASWKGPLSASALPPCQPLSPNPSFPLQAPHTLFRLQIGTSFKEVSAENCKLCGFSLIRNEWKSW